MGYFKKIIEIGTVLLIVLWAAGCTHESRNVLPSQSGSQNKDVSINTSSSTTAINKNSNVAIEANKKYISQQAINIDDAKNIVEDFCKRPNIGAQASYEKKFDIEMNGVKYANELGIGEKLSKS